MELRFLYNQNKLELWRNTIQLFHNYENFEGPFYKAGYKYVVERIFHDIIGYEKKPDIVCSSYDGWAVIDVTTKLQSKEKQLISYQDIERRDLGQYGLNIHNTDPDIFCNRLQYVDDGPFPQLILKKKIKINNLELIKNQKLRTILSHYINIDLSKLPDLPFTLVPEMKKEEIRRGIITSVMQIFSPGCEGKTPLEIVREGTERLYDTLGPSAITSLVHKIQNEMDILIKKHLRGYLVFKDGKYQSTGKFKQHYKTLEFISIKLREWSCAIVTPTLDQYSEIYEEKDSLK